ncbi:MAG: glycosyltransferase [Candidatus Tectimicrobiota bacterium]
MHIGLLTPSFPPMVDGGVAIATGRLVAGLARRGHRLTVLTTAPGTAVAPEMTGESPELPPGVVVHYRLVEQPQEQSAEVTALCAWAQASHAVLPFDVLLAYFVYPAGYLAVLLGQSLGVPVVCSCRGNDISKDMFIQPQILATVLQRSSRVIFVSASLLHMADTLVSCRARASVVANAVDSLVFTPATQTSVGQPSGPVVLGTSGVLRWKKGIDLLLPLLRELASSHAIRLLIAGYGLDAALEQQIHTFLVQHQMQHRVEMTGPLPHRQMVQALQRMQFYISTSYQEGMPNGILEAMACALPVVATDADGIVDLVQDGVTGYLCPMGDLEALRTRCQLLITQPEQRQRMGQAGRRRVQQCFTLEQEVHAVETVLRQACGR